MSNSETGFFGALGLNSRYYIGAVADSIGRTSDLYYDFGEDMYHWKLWDGGEITTEGWPLDGKGEGAICFYIGVRRDPSHQACQVWAGADGQVYERYDWDDGTPVTF
tara:strand:+ start:521 stop:841 length:321 start_codon:yes stop_codon:yes gene_type:complete